MAIRQSPDIVTEFKLKIALSALSNWLLLIMTPASQTEEAGTSSFELHAVIPRQNSSPKNKDRIAKN